MCLCLCYGLWVVVEHRSKEEGICCLKKKKKKKSIIRCGGRLGEREQKDYLGIF